MYAIFLLIIGGLNAYLSHTKCRFVDEIQVSRDLLRSMVNKTENGVFITDITGYIYDCNGRAEEMFGFSRREMLDHDFKMLRVKELNAEEIQHGFMSLRKDNFWSSETVLKRKDGSEFMAYIFIALLYKDGNQYLVYRVRDISKLKEHEQEIVAAKEAAEQAAKVKAQFLATMTHEIRTPLNGVIGMASVLQNTSLNEAQRDHVDTILKSGQSLMVLINDILDFSKMESGKAKLELAPTSIQECICEVSDLLRSHAESKGIVLSVEVCSKMNSAIMSDGSRMKQVLLNLIGNAIKFTHEGEVRVSAKMLSVSETHTELKIEIADTGIGIPEDKIHGLFDMFSQVDSSTSRKYGGTGLGLAISKQIAELLGGSISVSSKEGLGSQFIIHLKCELAKQEVAERARPMDLKKERYASMFSGVKILLAEDNPINQRVLCYMLEQLGLAPDIANNGAEALALVEANDYDLVFMDIQMPEMSGLDATSGIRALQKKQPIIVAMTANNSEQDRIECRQRGMDAFISKPFVIDQIVTCLTGFVQRRDSLGDGLHAA
jgi:PAS domain S-box-containing protein